MANPVATQTFDFVRAYFYERTGGAPGSGNWVTVSTFFDGTLTPDTVPVCSTFSAGGLESSDPMGIVGTSGNGGSALAFIGNGAPVVPYIITYPGQAAGDVVSADYWEVSQGAFYSGGAYFLPHFTGGSGGGILRVIRSATGLDGSWGECDAANTPTSGDGLLLSMQRVDNMLYFFISLDGSDTEWSILPFDMSANGGLGAYGSPFASVTMDVDQFGSEPLGDSWGNGLFKFPDGGFVIIYQKDGLFAKIWNTVAWSDPIPLVGLTIGAMVMDPSLSGIHVMNYHDGAGEGASVDYNFLAYPSGTVTSIANAIPAPSQAQDGIGHSSIQNGMLFVPRDDGDDFANSVWVSELPVATFSKELLPVPPGETDVITNETINAFGSGYASGDTGTIDGGLVGYPAVYRVGSIGNGIIDTYVINNPGSGYSPGDFIAIEGAFTSQASGLVASVDGGGGVTAISLLDHGTGYSVSSGVSTVTFGLGFGLTIDINSVLNGLVQVLTLTDQGGGYSTGAGVGTTPGGTQPGSGTGLTVDINSVGPKTPSCAYMMFPNGYSLTPLGPLSLACPVGGGTATIGVPYSKMLLVSGGTPPYTWEIVG